VGLSGGSVLLQLPDRRKTIAGERRDTVDTPGKDKFDQIVGPTNGIGRHQDCIGIT